MFVSAQRTPNDPDRPPTESSIPMADSMVLANIHRPFLWMPTWIPAFAGMTV